MRLRYRGTCESCGTVLSAGTTAIYDWQRRKVRCVECPMSRSDQATIGSAEEVSATPTESPEVERHLATGTAGGSAYRIYERRSARDRARRQARVAQDNKAWRAKAKREHPVLGRIASAITPKEVWDLSLIM